MDDYQNIIAWS